MSNRLALMADVGRSLADDDAFDRLPATRAGGARAAPVAGNGIEIGLTRAKSGSQVFQAAFEDAGDGIP